MGIFTSVQVPLEPISTELPGMSAGTKLKSLVRAVLS